MKNRDGRRTADGTYHATSLSMGYQQLGIVEKHGGFAALLTGVVIDVVIGVGHARQSFGVAGDFYSVMSGGVSF